MTKASTQFRLGLFLLGAITALVIAALALGWSRTRRDTVRYQTYFDESVQGLDLGSPVKYRGVRIGSVSDISIAPDRRHVSVGLEVSRVDSMRLQLERDHPRLRTQLATQGITGVKFVDIDVAAPSAPSPPLLGFAPPLYIPSRPSMLLGLQENIEATLRELPDLVNRTGTMLDSLRRVLDDVHDEGVAARVGSLLATVDAAANDVRGWIAEAKHARLPAQASALLADLRAVASNLENATSKLDGIPALLASAKRATDAVGDVGRSARGTTTTLDRTLRELADGARAVRELAEMLERDPDALVRGRGTPRSR